ncbi:hypothetical protein R3P38DRAFT_3216094 [Favolaschia claudopus]|uniref:Secreted protein n=1 Tax=Favolaschia claudopus TaxID=2862362 RepID=A0AAW0A6F1_9AGAR
MSAIIHTLLLLDSLILFGLTECASPPAFDRHDNTLSVRPLLLFASFIALVGADIGCSTLRQRTPLLPLGPSPHPTLTSSSSVTLFPASYLRRRPTRN